MRMVRYLVYWVLLSALCSCSSGKPTSSIQIQFQSKGVSAQSLSAEDIEIIIVNVSGPGIPQTMVAQKDCHEDGQICNSIELNGIPTGTGRLIQLLVVTKESDDGSSSNSIYYGDVLKELNGEASIALEIQEKASFENEADVSGRYIPKSGHALAGKYLTGSLDVSVHIGSGKPDMTIGSAEIFGGWFNIFALDNVNFKFHFSGWDENGNIIPRTEVFNDFHGGAGLNIANVKSSFASGSKKIASFNYNGSYMEQRDSSNYVSRNFEERIFAFFDGLSSSHADFKEICYDTSSFSFDHNDANFSGQSICKTVSSGVCTGFLDFNNSGNPNSEIVGSLSAASASCVSGNTTQKWELDIQNLDNENEFSGFEGLITNSGAADNPVVELSGSVFSWKADSKVTLNGFHILKKVTSSFESDDARLHGISDGYDCNKMKNELGFTLAASISRKSSNSYSYDAGAVDLNQLRLAICPLAPNGTYYKTAYFYNGHYGQGQETQLVDFKLYYGNQSPVSGFGFGDPGWTSGEPYIMEPTTWDNAIHFFVEIKNISGESVELDNLHINYPFLGFILEDAPGSTPPPTVPCNLPALPALKVLSSGDSCVVRIEFLPDDNDYGTIGGQSWFNGFSVAATLTGENNFSHSGFDFVAATAKVANFSDSTLSLDFYAPPGTKDYKYIKLVNNDSSPWPLSTIPDTLGGITVDKSKCAGDIPITDECYFLLTLDNTSGTVTDFTNFGPQSISSGSLDIYLTSYSTKPSISPAPNANNVYSFLSSIPVLSDDTTTFTLSNSSTYFPNIENISITGADFSLSGDACSNIGLSASCTFDITATHPGFSGTLREWLFLPYEMGGAYRGDLSFDVEAEFQ